MHALANRQVSVDLDAYDLARIQQPSSYPSPLYISPSAKPVFVCSRIVDYSIFDYQRWSDYVGQHFEEDK